MLWMKAWLETRWRLLFALAIPLTGVALPYIMGGAARPASDAPANLSAIVFFAVFNAAYLAGAGIQTQPPFRGARGLQGSMYYTLSLRVSRLRLLSVRAVVGILEFVGVIAVIFGAVWLLYPNVRASSTPINLLELIFVAAACTTCFYFVSVLLATFLDDPWQMFGGLIVTMVGWLAISRFPPPRRVNLFGFAGDASPLITHTLPWPAMAISLTLSAILFLSALKIAQNRDY
jgi:hypothetical protein